MTTRRVRRSVALSLDGFIAGPEGEDDGIPLDPAIVFSRSLSQEDHSDVTI